MKAVILAGGLGTRITEETVRIPKPMVEIGGRPILWHIMKIYSHYGVTDFVICAGYKGYVIKEYFRNYFLHMCDITFDIRNNAVEVHQNAAEPWRVTVVDTGASTMTGGRLKKVARYVGDATFCVTYGDGLSDINVADLIRFHQSHGKLATVTAITPPGRFGALEICREQVHRVREKPERTDSPINGGFFVLEPGALSFIDGDSTSWEREPMARLAAAGELMAYSHTGFWQPMDTLREKQLIEELWESGAAPWKVWA